MLCKLLAEGQWNNLSVFEKFKEFIKLLFFDFSKYLILNDESVDSSDNFCLEINPIFILYKRIVNLLFSSFLKCTFLSYFVFI